MIGLKNKWSTTLVIKGLREGALKEQFPIRIFATPIATEALKTWTVLTLKIVSEEKLSSMCLATIR